ncbi:MAG: cobyrinate a,c-diamide synthase [Frankiaceae bacterium]
MVGAVPLVPRVVVAAPSSGAGKTTVATGLMAALAARGHHVAPFKVGPDYIDPGFHALATGRPGRNLDVHLCGEDLVAPLLAHGSAGAHIAVVEGVMGLFDGRGGGRHASTAHVATLLGAPVLLVVDARGMSGSVAALVHGFAAHDPAVTVAGVVLNNVGSDVHEAMLRRALEPVGVPVLGAVRRSDLLALPSRHLGLVPVAERAAEARAAVDAMGAVVARSVDLAAVMAVARAAAEVAAVPWAPAARRVDHPSPVAVMTGPAFGFVYAEHLELLAATGADVVPIGQDDEALPEGLGALYVPGGFPEVHAGQLAANAALRTAVAAFARSGGTVLAECGGLLWLVRDLDGRPMCGALPASGRMTDRLTLGYRDAVVASAGTPAGAPGDEVRAHEFHYATVEPAAGAHPAWRIGDRYEGFVAGGVHASFLHSHWAATPAVATKLAAAGRRAA